MKQIRLLPLILLFLLPSCVRTPERILSMVWGVDVTRIEHQVEEFKEVWYPNGDGFTKIRMKVDLPQEEIIKLVSKGARPLPLTESNRDKEWLERISGIKNAHNGVYYFEDNNQGAEIKFLIYDKESQTLFYYLDII